MRISDWSSDVCSSDLTAVGKKLGRALNGRLCSPISRVLCGIARNRVDAQRGDAMRGEGAQRPLIAGPAPNIARACIVGDEERQPTGDLRADQHARRTAAARLPHQLYSKGPVGVRNRVVRILKNRKSCGEGESVE